MQNLMTLGVVSILTLASPQLGVEGHVNAGRSVEPESTDPQPSSFRSVDSPRSLVARRSQPRETPATPSPAGESKASSDQVGRSGATGGATILEDDFESETLGGWWNPSGNNTATITKSEHFRGQSSVMLKLGPTDSVNYRTELVMRERRGKLQANKDYCIRFAFKVKDWSEFPKWVTLFQTHAIPANGDFSCQAGRNSISLISGSRKNLALAVVDRPVAKRRGGAIGEVVHSQDLTMDHWYTAQFHYRPSFDDNGIIEAWIDGKKIYSQSGANMDPGDQCGRSSEPFTQLKLGLYKERGNSGSQTIYYDDFVLSENAECK